MLPAARVRPTLHKQIQGEGPRPGLNRFYIRRAAPREGWRWLQGGLVGPLRGTFGSLHRRPAGGGRAWARTHTPRSALRARQGAPPRRPTPRRTPGRPPRAGALPRAENPGRASSRQACELPPSRAPGELSLAAAAEPAAALPFPPHPAPCPGVLPGWGPSGATTRPRRRRDSAPASGPSRPSQPVAAGACGAWSAGSPPRPGRPPAAGATFQNQTLVAAFGSGTLPGPRRLHCFLPRFPLALLPPPFFPPRPWPRGCPLCPPGRPSFPSLRTHISLYRILGGPLRPSPLPWRHGPSCRPLMLPKARWPGPQCPKRALMVPSDRAAFL